MKCPKCRVPVACGTHCLECSMLVLGECPSTGLRGFPALPWDYNAPVLVHLAIGATFSQRTCLRCGHTERGPMAREVAVSR